MKKIISILAILSLAVLLVSCSADIHTSVSSERPADKKIIEVEAEEYGDNAYFTTKKELTSLTVNKMIYDYQEETYSLVETAYKKNKLSTDECLKIILDLEQEMPYIMVSYKIGNKQYEQYIYKNPESGKMLLLELEQ